MSQESRFLTLLRLLANDPAAQGLMDDVAILPVGDIRLILTSDTMVEGVHYLPTDPPADVGTGTIISEYVDVAHAFFDEREAKFVNGILDAIGKDARD